MIQTLQKAKKSKNSAKFKKPELAKTIDKASKTDFLNLEVKTAFLHLQTVFTKSIIFHYFDLKSYIQIETDTFGC